MLTKCFTIIFFISSPLFAYNLYEDQIPKGMVANHRKLSSAVIFNMIKSAKVDKNLCDIEVKSDGYYFAVVKDGHSFAYVNNVLSGEDRLLSRYECLLTSDKKRLECKRKLPGETNSIFTAGRKFVYLTIELDGAGNATSMYGKKTKEYKLKGHNIPFTTETITEFKCDIEHSAVVKDPTVSNGVRAVETPLSGANVEETENAGTTVK